MPTQNKDVETKKEMQEIEPKVEVSKEDYERLVSDYQKLAIAFNKLLKEYNDLHIQLLFIPNENK